MRPTRPQRDERAGGGNDGVVLADQLDRVQPASVFALPLRLDDGLDDGDDFHASCNPMDPDSDHDGIEDGDDDSPAIVQKLEAILDALVCPHPGVPGSITALGTTAILDDTTRFDDTTCAELATALAAGPAPFVEITILEDVLGVLTAKNVESEDDHREHGDDDDDDQGEDEDDD